MLRTARFQSARVQMFWGAVFAAGAAVNAWAVQAPVPLQPTHERQCVATGDIPAGNARRVTVAWKQPFATTEYTVIGTVADSAAGDQSLELSHVVVPFSARATSAIVFNRDAGAAHAGILCLDAAVDAGGAAATFH